MLEFARQAPEDDSRVGVCRLGQDARLHLRKAEYANPFRERQAGQFHVGLAGIEGIERQFVSKHHADRPAQHLRLDRQTGRRRLGRPVEHLAPVHRHRAVTVFEQRDRQGPSRALDHPAQQGQLGVDLPSLDRWKKVREVDTPIAPASTPSRTMRAIGCSSSTVAGSRSAPRCPIT